MILAELIAHCISAAVPVAIDYVIYLYQSFDVDRTGSLVVGLVQSH